MVHNGFTAVFNSFIWVSFSWNAFTTLPLILHTLGKPARSSSKYLSQGQNSHLCKGSREVDVWEAGQCWANSWLPVCSSAVTMWKRLIFLRRFLLLGELRSCQSGWRTASQRKKVCQLMSKDNSAQTECGTGSRGRLLCVRLLCHPGPRSVGGGSALPLWADAPVKIRLQPSQINTSPPCPNKRDFKAALSFCKGLWALAA